MVFFWTFLFVIFKVKTNDYVQLLLDAQSEEIQEYDESVKIDFTQTRIGKKLSKEEIQRNLVVFMLAGYETSSNALNYAFYILATQPEEQEKLKQEIDEYFPPELENSEVKLIFNSL